MCPDTIAAIEGLIAPKVTRALNIYYKIIMLIGKIRLFITFYNKGRSLAAANAK